MYPPAVFPVDSLVQFALLHLVPAVLSYRPPWLALFLLPFQPDASIKLTFDIPHGSSTFSHVPTALSCSRSLLVYKAHSKCKDTQKDGAEVSLAGACGRSSFSEAAYGPLNSHHVCACSYRLRCSLLAHCLDRVSPCQVVCFFCCMPLFARPLSRFCCRRSLLHVCCCSS